MAKQKIEQLQKLAREFVGGGGTPNLFFVTIEGVVITVTRSFEVAYNEWRELPHDIETALEDRKWGVICDTSPEEDGSTKLRTWDDSYQFQKTMRAKETRETNA